MESVQCLPATSALHPPCTGPSTASQGLPNHGTNDHVSLADTLLPVSPSNYFGHYFGHTFGHTSGHCFGHHFRHSFGHHFGHTSGHHFGHTFRHHFGHTPGHFFGHLFGHSDEAVFHPDILSLGGVMVSSGRGSEGCPRQCPREGLSGGGEHRHLLPPPSDTLSSRCRWSDICVQD